MPSANRNARRPRIPRAALSLAVLLCALLWLAPTAPVGAQAISMKAEAGLGGFARTGYWLPVTVSLENLGGDVEAPLVAAVGTSATRQVHYQRNVRLAAGGRQRHTLLAFADHRIGTLTVRFQSEQATVSVRQLHPTDLLVLNVSEDRSGLGFVQGISLAPKTQSGPPPHGTYQPSAQVYVAHTNADGLFDTALAYSSVAVVALGNSPLGGLTAEQKRALTDWVRGGGTLVVSGGSDVARLRDPFLAELLPLRDLAPAPVSTLGALSRLSGMPLPPGGAVVARGTPRPGAQVWVAQDGIPLVASRPHGNGQVVFTAFDYDQNPVRGWAGQTAFWRQILLLSQRASVVPVLLGTSQPPGGPAPVSLIEAVAGVPAMDLPSARLIGFFFLTYLICLGPLNYALLRRRDRREYAWATTPAIALAFCLIAWAISFGSHSRAVELYRLEVLESRAGSPSANGVTTFGLYSPRRARYTLEAPGTAGIHLLEPGSGFRTSEESRGEFTMAQEENTRVERLLVNAADMRILQTPTLHDLGGAVTAALQYGPGGIQGRITNGTRQELEGGVLLVGRTALRVARIPTGGRAAVDPRAAYTPAPRGQRAYGEPPAKRMRNAALDAVVAAVPLAGASDPVLIAWGPAPESDVRIVGKRARETASSLFVFHLAPLATSKGTYTIPASMIPGRVVGSGPNTNLIGDGRIYLGDSVEKEFALPTGLPLRSLTAHVPGAQSAVSSSGMPRVTLSLTDTRTGSPVSFPVTADTVVIPQPNRFVAGGKVRLRLSVPVGGSVQVHSFEISVVGDGQPEGVAP